MPTPAAKQRLKSPFALLMPIVGRPKSYDEFEVWGRDALAES